MNTTIFKHTTSLHSLRNSSNFARLTPKQRREKEVRDQILRVDHAGELGANRIYQGQMAVLGRTKHAPLLQHMWDQEKEHKRVFDELLPKYRTRPTALIPVWNVAGYMLGVGTAMFGSKMAMACTAAVESAITDHYNNQIRTLMEDPDENKELLEIIRRFRDDEMEHHDTAIANQAEDAPMYQVVSQAIKLGCKGAIWLSERI